MICSPKLTILHEKTNRKGIFGVKIQFSAYFGQLKGKSAQNCGDQNQLIFVKSLIESRQSLNSLMSQVYFDYSGLPI